MSYTLQALIANEDVISKALPSAAVVVRLPQGKAMIPFSDKVLQSHDIPFLPLTDEGTAAIPGSINALAEAISKVGRVVYVEAEFFGGDGIQASVTWDSTSSASQPLIGVAAINSALRFLGVAVGDHNDEFDALGLGRHRSADYWISLAEPIARKNDDSTTHLGSNDISGGPSSPCRKD